MLDDVDDDGINKQASGSASAETAKRAAPGTKNASKPKKARGPWLTGKRSGRLAASRPTKPSSARAETAGYVPYAGSLSLAAESRCCCCMLLLLLLLLHAAAYMLMLIDDDDDDGNFMF